MDELIFSDHARDAMRDDSLAEDDVYTVVGDYDEMIERRDGRLEYERTLDDGRHILVIIERDGRTVVTVWWNKRRSRRR